MFLVRWLKRIIWLMIAVLAIECAVIIGYAKIEPDYPVDVAIVLGASVAYGKATPVFRARIDYAVDLYQQKKVSNLIFTGGVGYGDDLSEAEVAQRYAIERNVPLGVMFLETWSRSTWQNLFQAKKIMDSNHFKRAVLVSDPLHLFRAALMAEELGLEVQPAATPYSRYISWQKWGEFLMRELYFVNMYWWQRSWTALST